MKQELPFAVALLATGCLLCFSQLSKSANSSVDGLPTSNQTSNQSASTETFNGNQKAPAIAAPFVAPHNTDSQIIVQASYQEDEPTPSKAADSTETVPNRQRSTQLASYLISESDPDAVKFLGDVAHQLAKSPPIGASIELTGNLFGQVVTATGNYYQMGQGSHKSRTELRFGTHPNSPTVIQLCDGRFTYKFQSSGSSQSMEFVDLERVRKTSGEGYNEITPTGWVASGGIASLFQHLASAFNFATPQLVSDQNIVLRGCWDEDAIRQIIVGPDGDPTLDVHSPDCWKRIPAQLPHAVEITFRKTETEMYFPKRIKFLQFSDPSSTNPLVPLVVLEFSAPKMLNQSSDRYFAIDSTDLDLVDMTDQYLARISEFDEVQQASATGETVDR